MSDPKQILSDRLKAEQRRRKWSGRELARQLKVSPTSVLGYLDATALPGPEIRARIAELIGLTPAELEAELFQIRMEQQKPIDAILADIRQMQDSDFIRVRQLVYERESIMIERAIAPTQADTC